MHGKKISALVVAAGLSSRMKSFKPLLKLGNKTIIEHVVDNLMEGGVSEIAVVTGYRGQEIKRQISRKNIYFIQNENYEETSMFDSVKMGLVFLEDKCDMFFFTPCDIPLFKPHTVKSMKFEMDKSGCSVVQPMYKGRHGHPVLFSSGCIPHLLSYDGAYGLKGAMQGLLSDGAELSLPDKGILMDADTLEDYNALKDYYDNMDIPSFEECMEILRYFKTPSKVYAHSIAVAEAAVEFASKLKGAGHAIEIGLVQAAALLHDVAKGEKNHAACGAGWLKELGISRVADVVESHMDLPKDAIEKLDERAVVYLADKLYIVDRRVSIEDRFEQAMCKFKDDADAMDTVCTRMNNAKLVLNSMLEIIGGSSK